MPEYRLRGPRAAALRRVGNGARASATEGLHKPVTPHPRTHNGSRIGTHSESVRARIVVYLSADPVESLTNLRLFAIALLVHGQVQVGFHGQSKANHRFADAQAQRQKPFIGRGEVPGTSGAAARRNHGSPAATAVRGDELRWGRRGDGLREGRRRGHRRTETATAFVFRLFDSKITFRRGK